MPVSAFRRSVANDTQKKGKGSGTKGTWHERMKLPKNTFTPLVFINAEYPDPTDPSIKIPYFKYRIHKSGTSQQYREEICTAGWNQHQPQPCAGCSQFDQTGDKNWRASDKFAIGVVHLAPYHGHPLIDNKTGGIVMKKGQNNQPSNEPFITYDECEGRTCNFCRVLAGQYPVAPNGQPLQSWPYHPSTITTIFGHRRYMEIGKNHLENLLNWDRSIGNLCSSCLQPLNVLSYNCEKCNSVLIDMTTDPRPDSEIDQIVVQKNPCPYCQQEVFLSEVPVCQNPQCGKATQFTLFDVVVHGGRQGEDTSSILVLRPGSSYETFESFQQRIPPQYLQGKTLRQLIADLAKPYNFAEMMKGNDIAKQMQRLNIQPMQQGGPQMGYQAPPMQQNFAQPNWQAQPQMPPQQGWQPPPQGYAMPGQPAQPQMPPPQQQNYAQPWPQQTQPPAPPPFPQQGPQQGYGGQQPYAPAPGPNFKP